MAQGLSLHIGLNGVDASKYNGWPGTLAGCVNDANSMQAIAEAQGFTPTQLITEAATADAILTQIGQAAHALQSGDTFLISYSGHGGQVPDATGDSPTGLDDTWVAYDRMICGHELYNLWSQFAPGVCIEVYSDSCHSGTVIRDFILSNNEPFVGVKPDGKRGIPAIGVIAAAKRGIPAIGAIAAAKNFATVFGAAPKAAPAPRSGPDKTVAQARAIPPLLALQLYQLHRSFYEAVQWSRKRVVPTAMVILISGCQDNQTSQDGTTNGLFTEKLLNVWNNGAFQGALPQFHQAILALMPSDQTPNYFSVGPDDPTFTNARPLTIVGAAATTTTTTTTTTPTTTTTQSVPPSISGPTGTLDPNVDPPTFTVTLGSNPYYIFEIAADPSLFGNDAGRTDTNFYGSWADPNAVARMSDPTYVLPQTAWLKLRDNAKLYYRVGSTSSLSLDEWNDYMVSVTDGDAATMAPYFAVAVDDRGAPGVKGPFASWAGMY
jgi:metacaspase-1